MASEISLGLVGLGISLGLRHGIDWDHIAAITDIAGSAVTDEAEAAPAKRTAKEALWLATCYALGHAVMVVVLGLLAIWASEFVPKWFDPLMERVVGVTLLILGGWVIYSLWRHGSSFKMQSRWMLVFGLIDRGWKRLRGKAHSHQTQEFGRYGSLAAVGIGLIHGFGAETGSQALLLASVVGVSTQAAGSVLLFAFVVGLLTSNSIVAAFSVAGFISARTRRIVYTSMGVLVAAFSLFLGTFYVAGQGDALPDLEKAISSMPIFRGK